MTKYINIDNYYVTKLVQVVEALVNN